MTDFVDVTITDLEQTQPPAGLQTVTPSCPAAILRAKSPPVHFYRYLYDAVGNAYNWISRRKLSDDDLAQIICDPAVHVYVLYINGAPAGFSEVDFRTPSVGEIKFFGLIEDFIGRGLGRYFFNNIVGMIWAENPQKIKLETCSLDHPAALAMYQKTGFRVTNRRQGRVELLTLRPSALNPRPMQQGIPSNER